MKNKKEIKNEYKQLKFRKGIFRIRNIINGKIYVGKANDLDKIWNSQNFKLKMGNHPSKSLQNDWNNLGEENFVFEIISVLKENDVEDTEIMLDELLDLYLEELKPFEEKGYNKIKNSF